MAQKEDKYVVKVRILDENGECTRGFYAATSNDSIGEFGTPCNVKAFFTREQAYEYCKMYKKTFKKQFNFELKPMQINVAMRDFYNYGIRVGEKKEVVSDEDFKIFSENYF